MFKSIRLVIGICLLATALMASQANASATVPVQAQFVSPPLNFSWNQVMAYKLKLVSSFGSPATVYLEFRPNFQLAPDAPKIQGKGGQLVYHRSYQLEPFQSRTLSFRVHTPTAPAIGASVNWCLEMTVMVKGAAPQSVKTCAIGPGK